MTEAVFWSGTVRPKLGRFGTLRRIENRIGEGTPDVAFCIRRYRKGHLPAASGWIETKHSYEWPIRETATLKFNHFTIEQVLWMEDWIGAGGRCFVLAQVARDYMLVPAKNARKIQAGATRREFITISDVYATGTFPTAEIVRCLTA